MATNHDAVAALPITSPADQTLVRNVLVQRMPYALADSDNPQQLVETDPDTGAVILDILFNGRVFHRDDTDTTTVHDGTTCLVTHGGKRYKLAAGSDIVAYSVLARTNTPPGSPSIGDAYLVTSSPTGDWAGHADDVAIYTARGWEFLTFEIGRFVYVEAIGGVDGTYWHKDFSGTWVAGFGNQSLGAAIVLPSNMQGGGGRLRWIVENQTTNAPPGSVGEGVQYIIGPSPTGAWAGNALKLANGEDGVWVIYTPTEGWRAYDKDTDTDLVFDGTQWLTASGNFAISYQVFTANGTWTKPARLIYAIVHLVASGATAAVNGATASFGAHCSATGGQAGGTGGSGSGGDQNFDGLSAETGDTIMRTAAVAGFGTKGSGEPGTGGAGGSSKKAIAAADLGATEVVTLGAVGANNGYCEVTQYIAT